MTMKQCEESYRRWLARKRLQDERLRAEELLCRYWHAEGGEQERARRERGRESKLVEWKRKKEEAIRVLKMREECLATRAAFEEKRRRLKGERAYRKWLRASRDKPMPVPLNQGELSMRGSVSSMYVNPIPWQPPT